MLEDMYKKVKDNDPNDTEVVYVSVDADSAAFDAATRGKPWPAMPYDTAQGNGTPPIGFVRKKIREESGKPMGTLQEKYSLGSVPSIVGLDGKTGNLISKDVRQELGSKPEDGCAWKPSAPESWLEVADSAGLDWATVLGSTLKTPEGDKPTDTALADKKHVALVFSGSWCPWCRAFEPMLEDMYKKVKDNDPNDTEVVYVSVDADSAAFDAATRGKPWPAMPYDTAQGNGTPPIGFVRKKIREESGKPMGTLQAKYDLGSVPSIVVLDGRTGNLISKDVRQELGNNPEDGCAWKASAPESWLEVA